jgi:hypothetical protein
MLKSGELVGHFKLLSDQPTFSQQGISGAEQELFLSRAGQNVRGMRVRKRAAERTKTSDIWATLQH